jgi:ankyrin repeat protein
MNSTPDKNILLLIFPPQSADVGQVELKTFLRLWILQESIKSGHLPVVEFLVASDSDLESKDNNGNTALHYAARSELKCRVFVHINPPCTKCRVNFMISEKCFSIFKN